MFNLTFTCFFFGRIKQRIDNFWEICPAETARCRTDVLMSSPDVLYVNTGKKYFLFSGCDLQVQNSTKCHFNRPGTARWFSAISMRAFFCNTLIFRLHLVGSVHTNFGYSFTGNRRFNSVQNQPGQLTWKIMINIIIVKEYLFGTISYFLTPLQSNIVDSPAPICSVCGPWSGQFYFVM